MVVSANAVICPQQRHILIDNVVDGFDIYAMNRSSTPARRFYVPPQRHALHSRGIMFGEAARVVMCRSDHGLIYVFDLKSSIQQQTLCHDDGMFLMHGTSVAHELKSLLSQVDLFRLSM